MKKENNNCILYRHIRLDKNEPFYIGIGVSAKRAYELNKRNKYWHNVISKTGYRVDILFENLTWQEACQKEIEFIKLYGRKDLKQGTLVNLTDGGDGTIGIIVSKETREKMSVKSKGNNRRLGALQSEETRKKISQSNIGKIMNEAVKQKISISHIGKNNPMFGKIPWNKGKNHSIESRIKMSESLVGRVSPRKGFVLSIQTRKKISEASKNQKNRFYKIVIYNDIEYSNAKELAVLLNKSIRTIRKYCRLQINGFKYK